MTFDVLPVLANPFESDSDFEQFDRELAIVRKQWTDVISHDDFSALQFWIFNAYGKITSGGILSQSTRSANEYQLTHLSSDGVPLSHHCYPKNNLSELLDELPYSTDAITVQSKVILLEINKLKKEKCIMSLEGDTADKMVHEGLEITETAIKLAGLGAKNLAALLLALLRDNVKLKGKTNMNRLLRTDSPLASFTIKTEDIAKFKKLATERGVLFTFVKNHHDKKALCDVISRGGDSAQVNTILESLGYNAPLKDTEKNAHTRALQGDKSNGRGFDFLQQAIERMNDPVKAFENKTSGLESLGAETLAAMVLKVAGENREFKEASPLSKLFADGQDIQFAEINPSAIPALQKQAAALDIPLFFREGAEGKTMMLAKTSDAPIINRLCENMLEKAPMQTEPQEKTGAPEPKKRGPGRPPKSTQESPAKESVRGKVESAKKETQAGNTSPAKTKAKAPTPKAPTR